MSATFRLLDLPRELRDRVYYFALVQDKVTIEPLEVRSRRDVASFSPSEQPRYSFNERLAFMAPLPLSAPVAPLAFVNPLAFVTPPQPHPHLPLPQGLGLPGSRLRSIRHTEERAEAPSTDKDRNGTKWDEWHLGKHKIFTYSYKHGLREGHNGQLEQSPAPSVNILLASRQLYEEAAEVLYAKNIFSFTQPYPEGCSSKVAASWLADRPTTALVRLRAVELSVTRYNRLSPSLPNDEWFKLCRTLGSELKLRHLGLNLVGTPAFSSPEQMRTFRPKAPGHLADDWVPILLDRVRGLESLTIQLWVSHLAATSKIVEFLGELRAGLLKGGAKLSSKGIVIGKGCEGWQLAGCTESADGHSVFGTREAETKLVAHAGSSNEQPEDMDEDADAASNAATDGHSVFESMEVETNLVAHAGSSNEQSEDMDEDDDAASNAATAGGSEDLREPHVKITHDAFGVAVDMECIYGLSKDDAPYMENNYIERDDLEEIMQYVNDMVGAT
ncbi:hypothetical protein BU16DRAFT_533551 [Lophium mytilinum]|uniref:Uncharacterized protein n=1 Tax=Lophium mytilinum TaxID=390894 RepID=A0A6A6RFX3_9PEZI|nr:hypothetical protein BU16DRAFT_533551 [Lophium mytilinum]